MEAGNITIIGGTGFEQLPPEIFAEPLVQNTRFGEARVLSISNNYAEPYKVYFLPRHGTSHGLAPHQINYRANIAALEALEVRFALATNAVGSLRTDLLPGSLVLFNDFIDFTRQRPLSYFDNTEKWQHTDFSQPYSAFLRECIQKTAEEMAIPLVNQGTYLCCDGPRFESPAEVRLFGQWGADVVGMTGLPEVIFAGEAGIAYAAIGIVTNLGAGLTPYPVVHEDVVAAMEANIHIIRELLLATAGKIIETLTQ